jgi:hypothetical protein
MDNTREPIGCDPYGSHQATLMATVSFCTLAGPVRVLELGMGWYSTIPLHYLVGQHHSHYPDSRVLSLDCHEPWVNNFRFIEAPWHQMVHVPKWDDWQPEGTWDVAFVDHGNDPSRVGNKLNAKYNRDRIRRDLELIKLSKADVRFVVVHDTELMQGNYGYSEVFPLFKHQWTNQRQKPFTSILSNVQDPAEIFGSVA